MKFCNSSENQNCKDKEETKRFFKSSYFYVYNESQDVDANNYDNPLKKAMKTYYSFIDFTRRKEIHFYMGKIELKTYDNIVYNTDPRIQHFNKQLNMEQDSISNEYVEEYDKNTVISMSILPSNKIQEIQRTYTTLIEAAAIVGGFSSFVLFLGNFLSFQYNDMELKTKLINSLYEFEYTEKSEEEEKTIKLLWRSLKIK